MSEKDVLAILPLLILAAAAIGVMLGVAVHRSHVLSGALTLTGLAAAFASLWLGTTVTPRRVTALLVVDAYSRFYIGLLIAAGIIFVLLAYPYFRRTEGRSEELYILMLVATLGAAVLAASNHFASLFLGLELLSVALYGMIAYPRHDPLPLEAGLKYLVLASVSAAFLVFGMALVYGALGAMRFDEIPARLARPNFDGWLVLPGVALITTGFGFKLALVPFHLWTPDVYQGAPAPVSAYIATVSKGAMFALLLRLVHRSGLQELRPVFLLFTMVAIASMFTGNILALLQTNVKRILAYSSIAHLGYLLVAFPVTGRLGPEAITFYLVAYFVTMLGAFGVISALSDGARDAEAMEDYQGLFWRRPVLAAVFTAMILSLAGIPVTAGFLGKFYLVTAGASAALWGPVIILVVTSVLGLYYYLRIVAVLYSPQITEARPHGSLTIPGALGLALLTAALILFGVFPQSILSLIREAVAGGI